MIRRHLPTVLALALSVAGSLAVAAPASAGNVGFSIGAQIPVGPGIVSLVIGQPAHGYGYGYGSPAYGRSWESQPFYYRVSGPLHRHGGHHHGRCYDRGGYGYHHPSCPSLHAYFSAYDVHPGGHWPYSSWTPDWNAYGWRSYQAPRYYGTYGYRSNDGRYHSRYDGRYNDRRYNDRRYNDRRYRDDRRSHDRRRHDGRRDGDWRDRDRRDRDRDGDHRDRDDDHRDRDWRDRD